VLLALPHLPFVDFDNISNCLFLRAFESADAPEEAPILDQAEVKE
jgi:hypothetical protein